MKLSPETWHRRYTDQARWTRAARDYLFEKVDLVGGEKILEVGCGTGAILQELSAKYPNLFGIDISSENLNLAHQNAPGALLQQADAHHLPFISGCFDIVYTHFVLLWLNDPLYALCEMCRVTKHSGYVLALAEPDYGGRIDNPPELSILGDLQASSLTQQGANPNLGRKLGELFLAAGLKNVQSGVIGGEWQHSTAIQTDQSEWVIILNDIESLPIKPPQEEIQRLKKLDLQARNSGRRVLYVPTFYALGQAPDKSL
jgi:SAM-dependent methyltransferase